MIELLLWTIGVGLYLLVGFTFWVIASAHFHSFLRSVKNQTDDRESATFFMGLVFIPVLGLAWILVPAIMLLGILGVVVYGLGAKVVSGLKRGED